MAGSYSLNFVYPKPASGLTDERLTVSSTAVPLASIATWAANGLCRIVFLDIQTQDVMMTMDGSDPTTTNGHLLKATEKYYFNFDAAAKMKFIRATGSDGTIHASPMSY